jgi:hypothetical protein
MMGVSTPVVLRWIDKKWLLATPRGESVNASGGPGDRWIITPASVRKFIGDNAALISSVKVNFVWLVDLLLNRSS